MGKRRLFSCPPAPTANTHDEVYIRDLRDISLGKLGSCPVPIKVHWRVPFTKEVMWQIPSFFFLNILHMDVSRVHALKWLKGRRVILASNSPRRREVLESKLRGFSLQICPSLFDESLAPCDFASAAAYTEATCEAKAREVRNRLAANSDSELPHLIVSADTVVVASFDDSNANESLCNPRRLINANSPAKCLLLEKPRDAEEAKAMLRLLSGAEHRVITAVSLIIHREDAKADVSKHTSSASATPSASSDFLLRTFSVESAVKFRKLTEDLIDAYVATGEPLDKAGAYGIQGIAAFFVESIHGCYYNVVGFPCERFLWELEGLLTLTVN